MFFFDFFSGVRECGGPRFVAGLALRFGPFGPIIVVAFAGTRLGTAFQVIPRACRNLLQARNETPALISRPAKNERNWN